MATNQHAIETKERQLQQTQQQLRDSQQLVEQFQQSLRHKDKTISDLQQTISHHEREIEQLKTQTATAVSVAQKDISKMTWREGKKAPQRMRRGAAVVDGNTAYFTPYNSSKVYSYQNIRGCEQWSTLPDNPNKAFSLAVIYGLLTSVGGTTVSFLSLSNHPVNTLFSLIEEEETKQWKELFPPMPTARSDTTCITTERALVVAGGFINDTLDTVEVMDINTKLWTTVCPLPGRRRFLSDRMPRPQLPWT